jgi:hypothetical protein
MIISLGKLELENKLTGFLLVTSMSAHEKRGRRLPPRLSCDDFLLWTITLMD